MLDGSDRLGRVPSRATDDVLEESGGRLRLGGYFWSPSGMPEHIAAAAGKAMGASPAQAGARGLPELREALAHETSRSGGTCIKAADVTVTAGAMAALQALWLAILSPGEEVITVAPDYFIRGSVQLAGGRLIRVRSEDPSRSGVREAMARIGPHTRAVYLSNPRNPTGQLLEHEDFLALEDGLAHNPRVVLVVDEAYERMSHDHCLFTSAWHHEPLRPNMVVVRSFSKSFALPGLRLGWVIAPSWVTSRLAEVLEWQQLYGSAITQTIAISAVLGDQTWLDRQLEGLTASRDRMVWLLSQSRQLTFQLPLAGPFVYLHAAHEEGSATLTSLLNARGVPVVSGEAFGDLPGHVRLPFSGPLEDVEQAYKIIADVLG